MEVEERRAQRQTDKTEGCKQRIRSATTRQRAGERERTPCPESSGSMFLYQVHTCSTGSTLSFAILNHNDPYHAKHDPAILTVPPSINSFRRSHYVVTKYQPGLQ